MLHADPGAGIVVPWNDVDAWSTALGRLLDDAPEAALMGREAERRARELYAPDGVGPRYVRFFDQVLDGTG